MYVRNGVREIGQDDYTMDVDVDTVCAKGRRKDSDTSTLRARMVGYDGYSYTHTQTDVIL